MAITIHHATGSEYGWHLLHTAITADETLLTADGMNRSLRQHVETGSLTFQVAEIGIYSGIEIRCLGTDANNEECTMYLFGWGDYLGPAAPIGTVVVRLGNTVIQDRGNAGKGWIHQADIDPNIKAEASFDKSLDFFAVDTYDDTGLDVDSCLTGLGPISVGAAEMPGFLILDLSRKHYTHLCAMFTGLGTGAGPPAQALSMGAVWRPLARKLHGRID